MKKLKEKHKHWKNSNKYRSINNLKCKWNKCSNQKTKGSRIDKKHNPYTCCLQEMHHTVNDTNRLKVKGWEKIETKRS